MATAILQKELTKAYKKLVMNTAQRKIHSDILMILKSWFIRTMPDFYHSNIKLTPLQAELPENRLKVLNEFEKRYMKLEKKNQNSE